MMLFQGEHLSLTFPGRMVPLLDDLSWTIRQGERWHVDGPSGAGKTSLVRIVSGLQRVDHGRVRRTFRRLGYVFAEPRLIDHLSVVDNVMLPDRDRYKDKARQAEVCRSLEALGMRDLAFHPAGSLSTGQKQRVNILRALSRSPDLLILDEAASGLDALSWDRAVSLIEAAHARLGFALIDIGHVASRRVAADQTLAM